MQVDDILIAAPCPQGMKGVVDMQYVKSDETRLDDLSVAQALADRPQESSTSNALYRHHVDRVTLGHVMGDCRSDPVRVIYMKYAHDPPRAVWTVTLRLYCEILSVRTSRVSTRRASGLRDPPESPAGGSPANRHRNAIWARVTTAPEENVVADVPFVMPSPTIHVTASVNKTPPGVSVNGVEPTR